MSVRKALPHDSSEPVCQSGIRSAGSRARSPTFPHPARALRAPGIFGVICTVSSCAPGLHVPRASTDSGGHLWESAPKGRRPRSRDRTAATTFQLVHILAGGRTLWPNPSSPRALGRKCGALVGARGCRRPFHILPGILLFLTAHQGKA